MTTVLRPDEQPRDNAKTLIVGSSEVTHQTYARPTAGTNAAASGSALGPGATDADAPPAGSVPGPDAYRPDLRGAQLAPDPPTFTPPNRSGATPTSGGTVK